MKTWHGIGSGWLGWPRLSRATRLRISGCACVVAVMLTATPAHAQGAGVTSVVLRQYLAGATTFIVAPFTIPVASIACNQTSPVTTPHSAAWDDADNPGKACVYVDAGTGPLFARVFGNIEATITNVAGALESPESSRAPFQRPPTAPTNFKVIR